MSQKLLFVPYYCRKDKKVEFAYFRGVIDFRKVGIKPVYLYNDEHSNTVTIDTLENPERYMSKKELWDFIRQAENLGEDRK